jgi:hypothetical protein
MNYKLSTDMAMNIMELCKAYEPSGRNVRRNGYVLLANVMLNDVPLPEMGKMKKRCSQKHFMSNQTVD